jgi:hypothetical protein
MHVWGRPPSPTESAPDECVGATDLTRKDVQILGVPSASPGTNRTPEFLDKSGKSAKVPRKVSTSRIVRVPCI